MENNNEKLPIGNTKHDAVRWLIHMYKASLQDWAPNKECGDETDQAIFSKGAAQERARTGETTHQRRNI